MEITVISVEQKPLDASTFAVPAGLKKMEMPTMPTPGGRPPR